MLLPRIRKLSVHSSIFVPSKALFCSKDQQQRLFSTTRFNKQQQNRSQRHFDGQNGQNTQNEARMLSTRITKMKNKQDVHGVLNLYYRHSQHVDAIHLANIYGTLAQSVRGPRVTKLQNDERFKGLMESTIDKLQTTPEWFDVRGIAAMTHSLGKLKIFDERFFNEIGRLRKRIAEEGNTQELSNIVWACATVGCKSVELLEAVAGEYERIAKTGRVQELSNITWAFAKAGHRADALFGAVAGQHGRIVASGNVQAVSNICWAFATAGHKADSLFEAVAGQHGLITGSGNVQAMSNTSWAFATVGHKADALFGAVAAQHERIVETGKVQAMSNICWAFATAGHRADALFEAVAGQHGLIVGTGNVQDLSEISWAFAKAGHKADAFFGTDRATTCDAKG